MLIRQAELKDRQEILNIVHGLYLDIPRFVWNTEDFVTKQIENKEYFVVEHEGVLAGVVSLRRRSSKVSIETLAVRKDLQFKGFGTKLIEFAKQFTKEQGFTILHAYSFKEYGIGDFYIKKGFKVMGDVGYYQNHTYDCFEMELS